MTDCGAPSDDTTRLATLRLDRTPGLGARGFARLLARYGNAPAALDALPDHARRRHLPVPEIPSIEDALVELDAIDRAGARYLAFGTPDYPSGLNMIADPPPGVIVTGRTELLFRPALAIVGSRNASAAGLRLARDISAGLGEAGIIIVSGLARGIDGSAHRGALETGTIAVLAGGIDHIYPPEHESLHREIAETGLLVSERPLSAIPTARCFPRRNRIISGLSLGTLVVEAALRSGSLITARYALEQNRDVMAVPGSPLDPRAKGTNQLLRHGAHLVENAEDILALLPGMRPLGERLPPPVPDGLEDEAPDLFSDAPTGDESIEPSPAIEPRPGLMQLVSASPVSIDEVARQSGRSIASVKAELFELEMDGQVECLPSGMVVRT